MKVSQECLNMLKHHEGIRYSPYKCPAGLWTVGVGHLIGDGKTLPPEWNRKFSKDEVDSILADDLRRFERGVSRLCPRIQHQGQFDALVSFAFNLGLGALQRSTLRMKHNRGDYASVPKEFLKWSKAGGKVLRGLLARRKDEARLYAKSK
jgi:lysozyme